MFCDACTMWKPHSCVRMASARKRSAAPGVHEMTLESSAQVTWKGECAYYNLTTLVSPGFPDFHLPDAMWSYESEGMGKCSEGWCPSAYTCKDIVNFGSFDPRVNIDDLGPCIKKGESGCKGGVCCPGTTCQFDPQEADFVCM